MIKTSQVQNSLVRRSASTSSSSLPSMTGVLRRKTSWSSWRNYFYSLAGFILTEYKLRKNTKFHSSKLNKFYSLHRFQLILVDASTICLSSPAGTIYFRAADDLFSQWINAFQNCCRNTSIKFEELPHSVGLKTIPPSVEGSSDANFDSTTKNISSDREQVQQLIRGVALEVESLVCRTLDESLSLRWSEALAVNLFLKNQLQQMQGRDFFPASSSAEFNQGIPDETSSPRLKSSKMSFNINRIEIGARIHTGSGDAANVHLATIDGWQCVVKELQCSSLSRDVSVRFEKELATLESLPNHDNLVRYLHHHRTPTHFQIFTSRYDTSLSRVFKDRIDLRQPFSLPEIVGAMIDVTRGVDILHRHEILHRDLKPDNIFVSYDRNSCVRRYIVGDFDSAKNIRLQGEACTFVGTLTHMAPEIFSQISYGSACDIWSIGIVLYELLTFELRDSQSTPFATMFGQQSTCFKIDSSRYPDSFSNILKIFDHCHQVNPSLRPTAPSLLRSLLDC